MEGGVGEITFPAAIMFEGGTNVPTDFAMFTEGGAGVGGTMGNNLSANGGKRSAVEVKLTEERGMSRQGGMDARRTEEVEGQSCLREETIPFSERELRVNGAENGNKVIFKSSNGTFSCVDAVFFRGNSLELDVIFGESILEILGTFVVENL